MQRARDDEGGAAAGVGGSDGPGGEGDRPKRQRVAGGSATVLVNDDEAAAAAARLASVVETAGAGDAAAPAVAAQLDADDSLAGFRDRFHIPLVDAAVRGPELFLGTALSGARPLKTTRVPRLGPGRRRRPRRRPRRAWRAAARSASIWSGTAWARCRRRSVLHILASVVLP